MGLRGKALALLGLALPVCLIGSGVAMSYRATPETEPSPGAHNGAAVAAPAPPEANISTAAFAGEVERRSRFTWPATGPMTSYVGPGHPTGVDIGLNYGEDSLIRAAAAGTVVFSGGAACCNYGLHVEIEHADGWRTLYAHFSRIGVEEGMYVEQGALLGAGGATGFAIGKHLHFELLHDEEYVDPLLYLPPEQVQGRPATPFSCPSAKPIAVDPGSQTLLRVTSAVLAGYSLKEALVEPVDPGHGEPSLQALPVGADLLLEADVPNFPNGRNYEYRLGLTLDKDGVEQSFDCTLSLKTMQSFPTMVRVGRPIATATRKPASTATSVPPVKAPATAKPGTPSAGSSVTQPKSGSVPAAATPKPVSTSSSRPPVIPTPRR
ncbi:MAG TPA: peptidoglycan DD-metalloendopeptidase family protein [Dehalococcoidia bacterium]|nr:peptidoglycan DD-metalloendopeptidase family protein [Dehalococcoidia bacterium]